jgi:PAS domain S-box-containing protein
MSHPNLLEQRNAELEHLVSLRTHELQQQIEREKLLSGMLERIRASLDLDEILQTTITEVQEFLENDRVIIYKFQPDCSGVVVAESVLPGCLSLAGQVIREPCFKPTWMEAYRQGKIRCVEDILTAPMSECHRDLLKGLQIRAKIIVPIVEDENLWGLLCAHYCHQPYAWKETEIDLLQKLAVQVAIALRQSEHHQHSLQHLLNQRNNQNTQLLEIARLQQAILDSTNYAIISTNSDGIIQTFNSAAEKLLGYHSYEVVGFVTPIVFHTAKEVNQRAKDLTNELHQPIDPDFPVLTAKPNQGIADENEWTWVRKDGRRFPVSLSVTTLRDEANQITGFLIIGNDITERKVAEQALRDSQRLIERIAEANPNILYIFDLLEQRNTYVNREIVNTLGYTPEEVEALGKNFIPSIMHPEDHKKVQQHFQNFRQAKDGDILEIEYRMRRRDGRWRWFHSWDTIFTRDDDGTVEQVLGTASDITERKRAEEATQQQLSRERLIVTISQRIRQSLDLTTILRTTVEEVQQLLKADRVLVYQVYPDGTGKTIAEGFTPGFPRVLNQTFDAEAFPPTCYQKYLQGDVYVLNDRDREAVLPCMVEFMKKFAIRAKLVVPIIQQDLLWGLLIAHQCSHPRAWQTWEINLLQQLATQLAIAIQQSNLYNQVQTELRERQRAQDKLRKNNEILALTNQELARATRLKDEFLANMSHELRTPLNAILGLSEALKEEVYGTLTPRQRKSLCTIEKSGQHLLELINDVLDLAKIEAGKLELQPTFVPVSWLCQSSLTFVKQLAQKKNISLHLNVPENLDKIEVDERRMRQVLINLLSNAVKFTPDGGTINITVTTAGDTETTVTFQIKDTGIGITPDDMGKLFHSFVQIDSSLSRRHEGTGLGLTLVRRIVELHQGSVTVESEVGKGSCFTVTIPAICSPLSNREGDQGDQGISLPTEIAPPRIFIAEDNPSNLETLINYLSAKNYPIQVAQSGHEAVKEIKANRPALVIIDMHLPEIDGLTVLRQLRDDPETKAIPIIALTALAIPGDKEKCLAAGASYYLIKPIRLQHLQQVIQGCLTGLNKILTSIDYFSR